ncbi:MAG: hypothetical protein VKO65_04235 [Cyanobacteriota bacterium]|nr:hypothetical protein [Cyanobacteriota bacterium]
MPEIRCHPEMESALFGPGDDDRRWFRDHPEALVRLRPQFPDEVEAMNASSAVAGGSLPSIWVQTDQGPLAPSWMAVVDLMRLEGAPAGPDGESCRMKLACPAPITEALGEQMEDLALSAVRTMFERLKQEGRRQRRQKSGRGFA